MNDDTRLQRLFQLLRLCGAAMIVTAAATFLVQRWDDAGDVVRYLALLGTTALLPAVAYLCGIRLQEGRSARMMVLAFLALLPIHAALLGGFVLSQFGTVSESVTPVAQWVAPSPVAAALLVWGAAAVLIPFAWGSFRILARPHERLLTACSAVAYGLLVIPSRSAATATLVLIPMLGIAAWCIRKAKPETLESRIAVGSLLTPAVMLIARQLLFYDVTSAFWCVLMASCAVGLVWFGRRAKNPNVERMAVIPTLLAMGALFDQALWRPGGWLSFGWASAAILVALAWSSQRSKRFFALSAMTLNAFLPATLLVVRTSPWAALQLLAVGLGFFSYGFVTGRRLALYTGASLAFIGLWREVRFAIARFDPSGWLALAGLGVLLVAVTAWLERRGRGVRLAEPGRGSSSTIRELGR